MAAKRTNTAANNANATDNNAPNKAEAIRQYHAENPNAGPSDIAKALKAKGVDVTASRVSTVLRPSSKKKGGLDVDTIKVAAEFAKQYEGSVDAKAAIEKVGKFIDSCGSTEKALEALDAYHAVAEAIG
ncbi:hypothetical protein C5Y96_09930 [Blastopirellula marina]|uniref:Uncharacterized protein n=1 Tax=Blastopirellula marina TaxID=124 RepID=A0A2S8FLV4_9BACT|nr:MULTISPECIES: hypothetical protein [Pirellulaceae]PQO33169.1 hypothetical protein C5Y96_09930 [Blastopirellula marina]RCS52258.1 hypothetical protein DTL36_09940 [Bremerella cremea]